MSKPHQYEEAQFVDEALDGAGPFIDLDLEGIHWKTASMFSNLFPVSDAALPSCLKVPF